MKNAAIVGALALALSAGAVRAAPADPTVGLFAQNAALANMFELEEAKIILQDSTTPALRAFAEDMVRDHEAAQAALARAGRAAGVTTAFVFGPAEQKSVDDLGLMDGTTLDHTYLADQVDGHARAAASLQSYAMSGSNPALVAYARATLPVVLHHQRMLEQLTGQPKPM